MHCSQANRNFEQNETAINIVNDEVNKFMCMCVCETEYELVNIYIRYLDGCENSGC